MSKTPKTDDAIKYGYRFTTDKGVDEYGKADFARGLEESETQLRARLVLAEQIVREAENYVGIGWDYSNESDKLMDLIAKWDAELK